MPTPAANPSFKEYIYSLCPAGIKIFQYGVTFPEGFNAAAVSAGVKGEIGERLDLALLVSEFPASAAGVFTTNQFCAAPVILSKRHLDSGTLFKAIVVNSGNANACTGDAGVHDARLICEKAAADLGFQPDEVLAASTGVIGHRLPICKILAALPSACTSLSRDGGGAAARAIMTTDTVPKEVALEIPLNAGTVRIGGMSKGSGMIHPNMATLLGFLTTDAKVSSTDLKSLLKYTADRTFNMITVDGDTSTNDSLFLLANGASGVELSPGTEDWAHFAAAMEYAAKALAIQMAGDGEGASKLFQVMVEEAKDFASAKQIAMSIARSSLVKTAIFGEDANWGRIVCAIGYSGVTVEPDNVSIALRSASGELVVCRNGAGLHFDEDVAKRILKEPIIEAVVSLGLGGSSATVWTCDLTYDYISVNASYRS